MRASRLAALACGALVGCRAMPKSGLEPDPDVMVIRTLIDGVKVEAVGGLDVGWLRLDEVSEPETSSLRIVLDRGPERRLVQVELPGTVEPIDDGYLIRLRGAARSEDGLVGWFPGPASDVATSVTWYVMSLDVDCDHADARRDRLSVALDWNDRGIALEIVYTRCGPPRFGPFGRPTLAESGPVRYLITRVHRDAEREVWVGTAIEAGVDPP